LPAACGAAGEAGAMGYRKIVQADKNTTRKSLSKEEASDFSMLPQTKLEPNY
jgi:hypothetical protein